MSGNSTEVKYYCTADLNTAWQMERAEKVILSFDGNEMVDSINEAIEIYNIQDAIKAGKYLQSWNEEKISVLKEKTKSYIAICARYFSTLNDSNLSENYNQLWFRYADDFWKLFDYFKTYAKIHWESMTDLFCEPRSALPLILKFSNTVAFYDISIAEYMRNSYSAVPIIIDHFWGDDRDIIYFPKSLQSDEYDSLFQKYIAWGDANPNYLQMLSMAQNSGECPISDRTKLAAKKALKEYLQRKKDTCVYVSFGIEVRFEDIPPMTQIERSGETSFITYDLKWFEDNLDYPTILSNFIYVFEQIDLHWRSRLPSFKSEQHALEMAITHKSKKSYPCNSDYRTKHILYSLQIQNYYDFLIAHGIRLEDVFKWFFMECLPNDFDANGFLFNPPSPGTTWLEKCRTIACEMDGLLKQYKRFLEDGFVNRELLEISSNPINVSTLLSFVSDKYAYVSSEELSTEIEFLFSDQSRLSYTEKTKDRYLNLYQLLTSERDIKTSDFIFSQKNKLEWLKNRGSIYTGESGCVCLNRNRCSLLKDLYEYDVLCLRYCGSARNIADELLQAGDLRCSGTLFSESEQDYYNFVLNKSRFDNGMDLRNKYIHGTYSTDEKIQKRDYFELLKIMIMIIAKINEECIIREEMKQNL